MNKDDPWAGAYVYGRVGGVGKRVAHLVKSDLPDWDSVGFVGPVKGLCEMRVDSLSPNPVPYPVCKDCQRIWFVP